MLGPLPSATGRHSAKVFYFFIYFLCRVPCLWHSAKTPFAECQVRHSAKYFVFFFFFASRFFSVAFIHCMKLHVQIWWNFVTFYYIFLINFISLISFGKCKFELQVRRIMKSSDSKNDSHASECLLRPCPGTGRKFLTSCSRNMRRNLRPKSF